uniref:Uncharacterized protein n=1 Tax=Callorhinchus milii TaxID=7868 RepID=A0A4W3I1C1_CALMI
LNNVMISQTKVILYLEKSQSINSMLKCGHNTRNSLLRNDGSVVNAGDEKYLKARRLVNVTTIAILSLDV